jgi:hypothetical protein
MYCGGNEIVNEGRIEASSLAISVVDSNGEAMPHARVQVQAVGRSKMLIDREADKNGRFDLHGLEPGEYWLGSSIGGWNLHYWRLSISESYGRKKLLIKLSIGT